MFLNKTISASLHPGVYNTSESIFETYTLCPFGQSHINLPFLRHCLLSWRSSSSTKERRSLRTDLLAIYFSCVPEKGKEPETHEKRL